MLRVGEGLKVGCSADELDTLALGAMVGFGDEGIFESMTCEMRFKRLSVVGAIGRDRIFASVWSASKDVLLVVLIWGERRAEDAGINHILAREIREDASALACRVEGRGAVNDDVGEALDLIFERLRWVKIREFTFDAASLSGDLNLIDVPARVIGRDDVNFT